MKISEFIDKLESYYGGELPWMARNMVEKYLAEYKEKNLPTLFGVVLKYHPINYGTPAIATIEKAHLSYILGDEKNKITGNGSLKEKKEVSACAPDPDENHEWEKVDEDIIALAKKAVRKV